AKPASFPETGKSAQEAGTVIAQGAAGVLQLAYADDWGASGISANGYNSVKVNGVDCGKTTDGAVGNSNPSGWSITTAATSGAVFRLDAKKDGYVVLLSKYSTNKNYWVFEGLAGEEEMCVAYQMGMQVKNDAFPTGRLEFALPADKDGYLNAEAPDFDKYVSGVAIKWPEKIVLGDEATDVKASGFGAIAFPVYEGCSYLYGAQGSKMTSVGFIYTNEPPVVTIYGTGDEAPAEMTFTFFGGSSEIENVIVEDNVNAPMYNIYGQRVNEDYKGLVIKNGVKFIN
ncbi:MAG: hypothetical protein K2K55_03860, partial [Duncaniella sp.]|nr:hypothetical protein [Duncaniella sp.]